MAETSKTTRVPVISGRHHKTMKLIDRLKGGKPGDEVSDTELEALIGEPVRAHTHGYGYGRSAIGYVRACHCVEWERIRGAKMLRCLSAPETVLSAQRHVPKIHRAARAAAAKLRNVDLEQLDAGMRAKAIELAAQVGTLAQFARADGMREIIASGVRKLPGLSDMLGGNPGGLEP